MNIKQYAGGKITEPGCYAGIPIELYHGDVTDGPGISSSGLRTIESKTPLHYWANSYLNPERLPQEAKEHFAFGHAAHTLLLSESGFKEKFVVRPEQWKDWRKDAAKIWRDEQVAAILADPLLAEIAALMHFLEPLHRSLVVGEARDLATGRRRTA